MVEEAEAPCRCEHPAEWHLLHASSLSLPKIRRGRCVVKVRNERGFPTDCGCKTYKAKVEVKT